MSEDQTIHIEVEAGPDRGRRIHVPAAGIRVGRSSQNDIELTDPAVSRFQCRLFFKPDGSLWVSDLGSTNQTVVNEQPVLEAALKVRDGIGMGDTILRVVANQQVVEPPPPAGPVDLGLKPLPPPVSDTITREGRSSRRLVLWAVVILAGAAIAGALVLKQFGGGGAGKAAPAPARLPPLEITYEKVRADAANIFRYALELRDRQLTVQVDSLTEGRHVRREKQVEVEVLGRLAGDLDRLGFFQLDPSYQGVVPEVHESADLTLTLGARAHRVKVLNRVAPESFQRAREMVEEFARNELGLAAVSLPPEKLLELGRDAVLLGRKLYAEREVRNDNRFKAIRAFEEAQWYAETLEPKPDFYADSVTGLEECKRSLQEAFENSRFQADRAIQLRDWPTAARQLQIICEMIPERADPRHADAAKRLLDVERRMQR